MIVDEKFGNLNTSGQQLALDVGLMVSTMPYIRKITLVLRVETSGRIRYDQETTSAQRKEKSPLSGLFQICATNAYRPFQPTHQLQ